MTDLEERFTRTRSECLRLSRQLQDLETFAGAKGWSVGGHHVENIAADSRALVIDLVGFIEEISNIALAWQRASSERAQ